METNKLKKIWNTLAEEKLIDKSLAKENILGNSPKKATVSLVKYSRSTNGITTVI